MIRVIITDTHFGWKQNSITWLNSQMKFIDNQLIPKIKELKKRDKVRLIHCGDVFDSRSSISPMIAKAVRDKFIELRSLVDDFYIVAGNHDFYSPNSDDIDSLSMVLRDLDINLVIKESVYDGEDAFIPWYSYKDLTGLPDNVKNVFTHADIFGEDRKRLGYVRIFSGHIHTPNFDQGMGLYNLGSCYPLNFADSNCYRSFYTLDDSGVHLFDNTSSIMFWRLRDEQIFDSLHGDDDYYELYITQSNMQTPRYQTQLSIITKNKKNVWIIPVAENRIDESSQFESYDVTSICRELIPQHLQDKFKQVEAAVNLN